MRVKTLKTITPLAVVALISCTFLTGASGPQEKPKPFEVQIKDKPLTFCNPINVVAGSERIGRMGEPVVVLYKGDYYLFAGGT